MRIRESNRPNGGNLTPESFCPISRAVKSRKNCASSLRAPATDPPIEPMPGELEAVRAMLGEIEKMLAGFFGTAYDRAPLAMAARAKAAELVEAALRRRG